MTTYPLLQALEDDRHEAVATVVVERLSKRYEQGLDRMIDGWSGFNLQPPRLRLQVYQAAEPVFLTQDPYMLMMFLQGSDFGPMAPVMETQMQVVEVPGPDGKPMAAQVPMEVPIGMAPVILGPWWRKLWAIDQPRTLKHLNDYRRLQEEEAKREAAKLEEALAEMPDFAEMGEMSEPV